MGWIGFGRKKIEKGKKEKPVERDESEGFRF